LARISEKHLGHRYDSKQVSRIVERATTDLEQWRTRRLEGRKYKFLYLDGAYFRVRINKHVSKLSFCAVLGVSEESKTFEVPKRWNTVGVFTASPNGLDFTH
jgi:transposase-like protein